MKRILLTTGLVGILVVGSAVPTVAISDAGSTPLPGTGARVEVSAWQCNAYADKCSFKTSTKTRKGGAKYPVSKIINTQTRWPVRRALMAGGGDEDDGIAGSLPKPVGRVRSDGLVAKSPAQLGTLTATYDAARALTASAQQQHTPYWLKRRLKRMGADTGLEPSDRLLLAMTCHRLALNCGPQADRGVVEAAQLATPTRLTPENERRWYGVSARERWLLSRGRPVRARARCSPCSPCSG